MEASLRLCEAGHAAARAASVAGANELEVWAALRGAIESAAGGRTALLADLVSGPRTQDVGGPPVDRVLAEGDLVICDLVPCHDGIWGDSCAAWAVGEPSAEARRLHAASSAALEAALAALRPGATGHEVDAVARSALQEHGLSYPHHTGHGVGFHYHEEPRAVEGSAAVLEPGMIVALEPGAYVDGAGVRRRGRLPHHRRRPSRAVAALARHRARRPVAEVLQAGGRRRRRRPRGRRAAARDPGRQAAARVAAGGALPGARPAHVAHPVREALARLAEEGSWSASRAAGRASRCSPSPARGALQPAHRAGALRGAAGAGALDARGGAALRGRVEEMIVVAGAGRADGHRPRRGVPRGPVGIADHGLLNEVAAGVRGRIVGFLRAVPLPPDALRSTPVARRAARRGGQRRPGRAEREIERHVSLATARIRSGVTGNVTGKRLSPLDSPPRYSVYYRAGGHGPGRPVGGAAVRGAVRRGAPRCRMGAAHEHRGRMRCRTRLRTRSPAAGCCASAQVARRRWAWRRWSRPAATTTRAARLVGRELGGAGGHGARPRRLLRPRRRRPPRPRRRPPRRPPRRPVRRRRPAPRRPSAARPTCGGGASGGGRHPAVDGRHDRHVRGAVGGRDRGHAGGHGRRDPAVHRGRGRRRARPTCSSCSTASTTWRTSGWGTSTRWTAC